MIMFSKHQKEAYPGAERALPKQLTFAIAIVIDVIVVLIIVVAVVLAIVFLF